MARKCNGKRKRSLIRLDASCLVTGVPLSRNCLQNKLRKHFNTNSLLINEDSNIEVQNYLRINKIHIYSIDFDKCVNEEILTEIDPDASIRVDKTTR